MRLRRLVEIDGIRVERRNDGFLAGRPFKSAEIGGRRFKSPQRSSAKSAKSDQTTSDSVRRAGGVILRSMASLLHIGAAA